MRNLRQLLPSAGSLIVFEAAGRLSSFTAAGRELGMTQAAVSYSVRALEEQLGAKLFQRRHRQVSLTEAGERFHADVSLGLSHIRKSAEDLRLQTTGGHVTLAASTAFGSFWMMPRLQQFRDELPGIDLRIQTADRDLDIIAEGIPLGVRGGEPKEWADYHALPLADEEIFPVVGTSYVAKFGKPETVEELATHRLIHLEEPFREAASWDEWFASAGASLSGDAGRGLRINDYALVIQAVMEGQGIALGWRHLVERLLASGLLVRATDHVMTTGKAFYVIWPKNRELSDNARKVRDWLAAQA
ncbi:MAG: LysR family transcriptional regulator [Mesorhizobium sp.]|nr:MAG: LysR family transcriptional regulator [Mesorhizobium sp.]TJW42485.1 MAG: LysR family transcriptional regulator [Mesorhizobium sp.]